MDYNSIRRKTKAITVGNVIIGGDAPVSIQSMTNTDTHDTEATYRQVTALSAAGCDIVRITAPDLLAVETFRELKRRGVSVPLVADIHFDYKIAVAAAPTVDKIRINPGNIGDRNKIKEVVRACKEYSVPIRIGVNSGSLEEKFLKKYSSPTPEALAESAMYHIELLRDFDFHDIAVSVKSSDTYSMIRANEILADSTDIPIHLGVTEAGEGESALIKSSIGIGALLSRGIGDTLRVSLTDDPSEEAYLAKRILSSLGIVEGGMNIIGCPTCGRTKIDLISLIRSFKSEAKARGLDKKNITVALMGCAVNGPGEAREADIGIAGGNGEGLVFKRGEIIKKVKEDELLYELLSEIERM